MSKKLHRYWYVGTTVLLILKLYSLNAVIDAKLSQDEQNKLSRVIDLDIDIGADAVDYK